MQLRRSERRFLETIANGGLPAHIVRTGTRVDAGYWFWNPRACLAIVGNELLAFAPGPRPFVERHPLGSLAGSVYNHVTGELLLVQATSGSRLRRIRLRPMDGNSLLTELRKHNTHNTR